MFGIFPPPAARANVIDMSDCTGARLAANAGITFVVQHVVRDIVFFYVIPHLFFAPVDKGVYLEQTVALVAFDKLHIAAGHGLAAAQAANPSVEPFEGTRERLKLAHLTTCVTLLNAIIKRVYAMGADEILQGFSLRAKHFHLDIVMQVGVVNQTVCLGEKTACVECEDAYVMVNF